jgi:hypothetical protein
LNPLTARAAVSGLTLSAPRSLFLEESGVVAELDGFGRFGRTAEADIPDSLKDGGEGTIER